MSDEQVVVKETLESQGYPSADKMVELVNNDLLPFFDEHKPTHETNIGSNHVVDIVAVSGKVFLFEKADGQTIGIWKEYFLEPEVWKSERLKKWAGQVY
jgi:hypothetical protein